MSKKPRALKTETHSVLTKFVPVSPKTPNQKSAFYLHQSDKHLVLTGLPGTGKTLLALNFAFDLMSKDPNYRRTYIVRSAVPTRDMGFMPGDLGDKAENFEAPYHSICKTLFPESDNAYPYLKGEKVIEFYTTSYIRGITLSNAIIILDEAQNCTPHEIFSMLTRLGENCRVIVCGDAQQSDLVRQESGLGMLVKTASSMEQFGMVEFTVDDIVRSKFVKDFIIAWTECQSPKNNLRGTQNSSIPQLLNEKHSSSTR